MICDALQEDEIFEAYLLYASLHGLCTDESEIRAKISSYLDNKPDSTIDDAILAFAEDRIVAPPDVVLEQWGKSRMYELVETPQANWRHCVSESWFENGCQFYLDDRDARLAHFWTKFPVHESVADRTESLPRGTRLRLRLHEGSVLVAHREVGELGQLPAELAREIVSRDKLGFQYLPLIESIVSQPHCIECKVLVTTAADDISREQIVAYAAQAFHAVRVKC